MIQNHPCKKNCPDRTPTCRLDCKAWLQYVEERNANYVAAKHSPAYIYTQYVIEIKERIKKYKVNKRKRR